MWEYRVVRRRVTLRDRVPEATLEKALNSYAQDGWEYTNLIRHDELFGSDTFIVVFRREVNGAALVIEDDSEKGANVGRRPIPPGRR